MSREQFFKLQTEEIKPEEPAKPEELDEWEKIKKGHLAAKEAFRRQRALNNRTGEEKYRDKKYGRLTNKIDRPSV